MAGRVVGSRLSLHRGVVGYVRACACACACACMRVVCVVVCVWLRHSREVGAGTMDATETHTDAKPLGTELLDAELLAAARPHPSAAATAGKTERCAPCMGGRTVGSDILR